MTDFPPEAYESAIAEALKAGDLQVAVSLLRRFAVTHPYRAEKCLNAVQSTLDSLAQLETNR